MARARLEAIDWRPMEDALATVERLLDSRASPPRLAARWRAMKQAFDLADVECGGGRWRAVPSAKLEALMRRLEACPRRAP